MKSEQDLLDLLKQRFPPGEGVETGIGDDAAVLRVKGKLVATTDLLIEKVHFTDEHPPFLLGRKAVSVNLSDLAAMGARARFVLIGLALPPEKTDGWIEEFMEGVSSVCKETACQLVGGDLSSADKVLIAVTALGEAQSVVERQKARPGDKIVLAGSVGLARAGLEVHLEGREDDWPLLARAYLNPSAKLIEGQQLAPIASSMIDVSDGFVLDLKRMLGKYGAIIEKIPIEEELIRYCEEKGEDPEFYALYGGEDYALIASIKREEEVPEGLFVVGEVIEEGKIFFKGKELKVFGYDHFHRGEGWEDL